MSYARLLAGYREANIIGTKTHDAILLDHVLDSLSCFLCKPLFEAEKLIDVGSGGGLPGIPLKIFRGDLEVTLVEATRKKARFLEHAARRLDLSAVDVVASRVEELARDERYRAVYDFATARALAALPVLLEYCVPLLKRGGRLIAMKGRPDPEEIAAGDLAAAELGASKAQIIEVPVLSEIGDRKRTLVVYKKVSETPEKYPRRTGIPGKRPLGAGGKGKVK